MLCVVPVAAGEAGSSRRAKAGAAGSPASWHRTAGGTYKKKERGGEKEGHMKIVHLFLVWEERRLQLGVRCRQVKRGRQIASNTSPMYVQCCVQIRLFHEKISKSLMKS